MDQLNYSQPPPKLRTIKSFVRRRGHLTANQRQRILANWHRYGIGACPFAIDNETAKDKAEGINYKRSLADNSKVFDFSKLFKQPGQVVLEIGFGEGASLAEMARTAPEKNFLGIEVYDLGVAKLLSSIEKHSLQNIKIISADAVEVITNNIPDNSLAAVNLFFPDPWPKARHHKRRLVQPKFVELLAQKMQLQGKFYLATDWEEYAQHMLSVLEESSVFSNAYGANNFAPRLESRIITKFERKAKAIGREIWDLCFQVNERLK